MSSPTYYFAPNKNVFGAGSIKVLNAELNHLGVKKILFITDDYFAQTELCKNLVAELQSQGYACRVWSGVQPNPTDLNVKEATALYFIFQAELIISLGGGSVHDCAKAVAIMAKNSGEIYDYEGIDQVKNKPAPLFCINTTAGTAAELTRFAIITDTRRKVKMALIDWQLTPLLAINDAETMRSMPPALTAATGLDALTHAVEAYVSTAANPLTDSNALAAIDLIFKHLPLAFQDGDNLKAREQMAYAQFLAGLAFNNASLGYVHAMAHQLGGYYDLPHGVCNAILLPVVQSFNLENSPLAQARLAHLARYLGLSNSSSPDEQAARAFIYAIEDLKLALGIPAHLGLLGVKPQDFELMAKNAMQDPCGLTNPVQPSLAQVIGIFQAASQAATSLAD